MAAFVKVVNDGLYMAKFEVNWEEPAADGNWVSKSWDSASQPVRYSEQVEMPGNARNVRIQAWAATGLLWEQWAEILDVRLNAPDNKVYRVFGTTLDRGWDNNDIKPLERAPDDGTIGGFRPPMTGWGGNAVTRTLYQTAEEPRGARNQLRAPRGRVNGVESTQF